MRLRISVLSGGQLSDAEGPPQVHTTSMSYPALLYISGDIYCGSSHDIPCTFPMILYSSTACRLLNNQNTSAWSQTCPHQLRVLLHVHTFYIVHITHTYMYIMYIHVPVHVHTHAYHLNHALGLSVIYPIVDTARSVFFGHLNTFYIEGSHIIPSLLVVSFVGSITEWELRRKKTCQVRRYLLLSISHMYIRTYTQYTTVHVHTYVHVHVYAGIGNKGVSLLINTLLGDKHG